MVYDYEWFKGQIFNITSINLNAYKEKQMKRRIDTLIGKYKVTGYDKFVDLLKKDKEVFDAFVNYLTINVSEFFRNKDQWELMDKQMIPTLIQRFGNRLDVWSAACSTGDEPYTLAIEKAKNGLYGAKDIAGVPADLKSKYFAQEGSQFRISNEIKKCVQFKKADLLRDPYPVNYHLIVCRNVMIYFTEEAKDDIYNKFFKSLAPEGFLFIGSTEQIINYKDIGFQRANSFYYEKPKS